MRITAFRGVGTQPVSCRQSRGTHQGIFATWADDGVDLMPGEDPIVGKKAVVASVEGILANLKGYREHLVGACGAAHRGPGSFGASSGLT